MKKLKILFGLVVATLAFTAISCPSPTNPTEEEASLTGISVNSAGVTKEFAVGEDFSYEGLIVKAVYSDSSKKTLSEGFTVSLASANLDSNGKIARSSADSSAESSESSSESATSSHRETAKVTVSYEGFTESYNVTISDVITKLEVTVDTDKVKTSYSVGDSLDTTGVTVKAFYGDDDTTGEDVSSLVTISAVFTNDASADTTAFSTENAGSFTLKYTASVAGVSGESGEITIKVKEVSNESIISGAETDVASNANAMIYWADQNWCGSTVTVNSASVEDGVYTVNYSATGSCTYGLQLFMGKTLVAGNTYLVSYKVSSSVAKTIKANNTEYTLLADTPIVVSALATGDGVITVLSIQNAISGDETDSTFTVSDIVFTTIDSSDLVLDSISASISASSISVGDSATVSVLGKYKVTVDGTEYEIQKTLSADDVSLTADESVSIEGLIVKGVSASDKTTITATSGEKTTTVDVVVAASKDYTKYWNASTTTASEDAPADYFSIWADQNWCGSLVTLSDMTATETSASLTQTVTGSNWFGTQIWYALATSSDLTFKVTSSVAGDITVNTTVYTLEANTEKEITVKGTTKLAIQLGKEDGGTQLGDCTFSITDFTVTTAE